MVHAVAGTMLLQVFLLLLALPLVSSLHHDVAA
jgi:hypothetical protein